MILQMIPGTKRYGWVAPTRLRELTFVSLSLFLLNARFGLAIVEVTDSHFERGMQYLQLECYDQAMAEFRAVLTSHPTHAEAYCQLGTAYRFSDRPDEAAEAYQQALTLPAHKRIHGLAHLGLGILFHRQGRSVEAERHGVEAVQRLPDMAEAHYHLGEIYTRQGRLEGAVGQFNDARRLDPDLTDATQSLGRIAFMQDQTEKAIDYFQEAIRRTPYKPGLYFNLAKAYRRRGDLKLAEQALERFKTMKSYADDVSGYRQNLEANPMDLLTYVELAALHQKFGNISAAIRTYQTATALEPSFAPGYSGLGLLYMKKREFPKAIDAFKKLARLDERDGKPCVTLGWLHLQLGDRNQAKSYLQEAIKRDATLVSAYRGLADIYLQEEDAQSAIHYARKVVELAPTAARFDTLAQAYFKNKQYEAAENALQKALGIEPHNPKYQRGIAQIRDARK